ncbi:hypothetical protein FOA43_001530 [Brettanomyces nanus]|uniref:Uncharacterized protein n=1 Tax=Eeniella nana TaxID=13502 RepID=A0A875RYH9_EENNA|nr:uncharacterized protein FOA43_001530 [Brettanomyces nanus]QPG74206.1 hypothetical protein FOA43_001530 [Brettanomyces nanus]
MAVLVALVGTIIEGKLYGYQAFILGALTLTGVGMVANYIRYAESVPTSVDKDDQHRTKSLGQKQLRLIQVFQPVSSISGNFFRLSTTRRARKKTREAIERCLLRLKDASSDESTLSDSTLVDSDEADTDTSGIILDEADAVTGDNSPRFTSWFMENYSAETSVTPSIPTTSESSTNISTQATRSATRSATMENSLESSSGWHFAYLLTRIFPQRKEKLWTNKFEGLRPLKLVHPDNNSL